MSVPIEAQQAVDLKSKVDQQGLRVRELKSSGGEKSVTEEAVKLLLQLKSDYTTLTGVTLGGGGSNKKDKKASKKSAAPPQGKVEGNKQKQKQAPVAAPSVIKSNQAVSVEAPAESDMGMTAVLGRLAMRATKADQLIAHLKTQLTVVKQTSALSACKAEEEKLRLENEKLKDTVRVLKERLIEAEIGNGVAQVAIPLRSTNLLQSDAKVNVPPVTASEPAAPNPAAPQTEEPPAKQSKKKEKKGGQPAKKSQGAASELPLDVSRLDMRIGKIVEVKRHPDADTLYVEEVDLGEEQPRTIVSGLVNHVPIEQMQDRIAIFLCNIKPVKMRGIFSQGMIMCGSTQEKVEIIIPPSTVQKGDRIYVDGFEGKPDEMLNPKKKIFEHIQPDLRINAAGLAVYKGAPWKVRGSEGNCAVPTMKDTPIK